MNDLGSTKTSFDELKAEHESLSHEIDDWRKWWGELSQMGWPRFGEMGDRLARFREHLAAHFAHEERLGALPIVSEQSPENVAALAELQDEHRPLLEELQGLIDRLKQCEPDVDCWGNARQEFEVFLGKLYHHEEAEAKLQR